MLRSSHCSGIQTLHGQWYAFSNFGRQVHHGSLPWCEENSFESPVRHSFPDNASTEYQGVQPTAAQSDPLRLSWEGVQSRLAVALGKRRLPSSSGEDTQGRGRCACPSTGSETRERAQAAHRKFRQACM